MTCNRVAANVTAANFQCSVPISTGQNTINVVATDRAGSQTTRSITVTAGIQITDLNPNDSTVLRTLGLRRGFQSAAARAASRLHADPYAHFILYPAEFFTEGALAAGLNQT